MSTAEDLVKACQERDFIVRVALNLEQDNKLRLLAKKTGRKKIELLNKAVDDLYKEINGGAA